MDKTHVAELYAADHKTSNRVIIEHFLMPKLGIKTCSQVTLPRDMNNGEELAEQINVEFNKQAKEYEEKFAVRKLSFSKKRMVEKAVKQKQSMLAAIFNELVYKDESYLELISWGRIIGLLGLEYEVRPSLREMVLIKDPESKEEVEKLMKYRGIIYQDAKKNFDDKTPIQVMLYPEELIPQYVAEIGRLSGYPECCIKAYMADRQKGDNPRIRGVLEYFEACKAGKEPEPWAYFTSDFVPCRTDCRAAQAQGKKTHKLLGEISAQLAEDYFSLIKENVESFEEEGRVLKERILQLQKETQKK